MPNTADFDIQYCVLCDDVRREDSGKELLIGIYSVGISVPFMPWYSPVAVWLRGIWSGEGDAEIAIKVIDPKGTETGQTQGSAKSIWRGYVSTVTVTVTFEVSIEGNHEIHAQVNGGSWKRINQFPVYLVPSTNSNT